MTGLRPEQRRAQTARLQLADVLALLDGVSARPDRPESAGARVPLTEFQGAALIDGGLQDLATGDQVYVGEGLYDLWPVRTRAITSGACGEGDFAKVSALQSVGPRDVRGRVTRCMPRMLRLSRLHIAQDLRATTTAEYFGIGPDELLINITPRSRLRRPDRDLELCVRALAGLSLHLRYSWIVELRARTRQGLTIHIPTSPTGARQLLSLRDVPDDRDRRAALRHWVTAHSRRVRRDETEREVDVREHLRGAVTFEWDGISGIVRPSAFDLDRAAVA